MNADPNVELLANRRRMRREGVALLEGDPSARYPHRAESRYPITVRPAYRRSPRPPQSERVVRDLFDSLAGPVLWLAGVLIVATIVAQAVLFFRHHIG